MSLVLENRQPIVMNKKGGIFAIAGRAKKAIAEHGADAVINSTLGAGLDESGKPFVIPTFVEEMRFLVAGDPAKLCAYTPPGGRPGLAESYPAYLLDGVDLPAGLTTRCIPTNGGTGALALCIANMAGESVVTHYPHWPNYGLVLKQAGRTMAGFELLDSDLKLDLGDFERVATETAKREGRLLALINSPYSNPTGSSIEASEWEGIADVLASIEGPRSLVLDLAYIDFGPSGRDPADLAFLSSLFAKVPDLGVVLVPTISKSFMGYGWRLGAAILLASDEAVADQWFAVMEGTVRGTNSNHVTAPQLALEAILASDEKKAAVAVERQACNEVVQKRFAVFAGAAAKAGLSLSKPTGGYFTQVYVDEPGEVAARLEERNVFTVPIARPGGLRISICALTLDECERLPAAIAAAL